MPPWLSIPTHVYRWSLLLVELMYRKAKKSFTHLCKFFVPIFNTWGNSECGQKAFALKIKAHLPDSHQIIDSNAKKIIKLLKAMHVVFFIFLPPICRDSLRKTNPYVAKLSLEDLPILGGTSSIMNNGSTPHPQGQHHVDNGSFVNFIDLFNLDK